MGNLATFLQHAFSENCPQGWICRREVRLLPPELERFLGYSSRADVVLEREDGTRRLWIEFEISRADPVANHAKFATAHIFQPQVETDCFVAMMSAHVERGRRNLAANTILLMRHVGMCAFQTVLLPNVVSNQIKRLNHLELAALPAEGLPVKEEIERALAISQPLAHASGERIHLVGDLLEVMLNLLRWNQEMSVPNKAALWKRRVVTYFVFDPRSGTFAPSKFCAFTGIPDLKTGTANIAKAGMTMELYAALDESEVLFDGHRAQVHLTRNLAMTPHPAAELPQVAALFEKWLEKHRDGIKIHPRGAVFLLPPSWFV
jgi:hypothetical protein